MSKLNTFSIVLIIGAAIYAILFALGCEECETGDTRCNDDVVQVCNSDHFWEDDINCSENQWICCFDKVDEIHTCCEE